MDSDDVFAVMFFGGAVLVGQFIGFLPTIVILLGIGLVCRQLSRP